MRQAGCTWRRKGAIRCIVACSTFCDSKEDACCMAIFQSWNTHTGRVKILYACSHVHAPTHLDSYTASFHALTFRVVYAAVIDRRPPRRLPRRLLLPRAWPCQAAAVRSQRPRRVAHAGRAQSVAHTQICRCRIQHVGTLCSPQGPRARWLHGTAGRLHSISAAQRRQPVDHPRPRSEEQPGLARLRRGARIHGGTGLGGPRGAAHGPSSRARPRAPRRHLGTAPATRRTGPMPLWPQ